MLLETSAIGTKTCTEQVLIDAWEFWVAIFWNSVSKYFFARLLYSGSWLKMSHTHLKSCWRAETGNDRLFEVLVTHICIYLAAECRNRSENLTNRKLSIFYIETMILFFFSTSKQKVFSGIKNIFRKIFWMKIFFVIFRENRKKWKFLFFWDKGKIPRKIFWHEKYFWSRKKNFFFGVEKKKRSIVSM